MPEYEPLMLILLSIQKETHFIVEYPASNYETYLQRWLCIVNNSFTGIKLVSFHRYFEGGVSSVYLWDLDHGFAGVILVKKGIKI